jgi:asparagine synthase (glutamine-hydrolysing)
MCGICGIVDLTGRRRIHADRVRAMCAAIRHRGPDGDGFYESPNAVLGMRRLAIIDVEGSQQPLHNEDDTLALVFNGEIYNYRELRKTIAQQGHHLLTDGDGETLLHLYEQYDLDLFRHVRGMYAFAIWDMRRERLVLAVDHIGMKPLYLVERDGFLTFASEVKALLAGGAHEAALNLNLLDTYLSFGYMIGEQTLFDGIRRLMPGHALVVEQGQARTVEYWRFGDDYDPPAAAAASFTSPRQVSRQIQEQPSPARVIARAGELIEESIRLHLRSDVPLGLFLSGGVDSATVLALMSREAGARVQTYTVGYAADTPDNELAQARRIAAHFSTDHHERVITAEDWWAALQAYVYHHDEPNANASAVSLMLLAQETARHVKVVLTGLGGDELFGGYASHRTLPSLMTANARLGGMNGLADALGALERHYAAFKRYRIIGALPTYLPRLRHLVMPRDEALRRSLSFDGMVHSDTLRSQLYAPELRSAWQTHRHKERVFAQILTCSLRDNPTNTIQALVINTWLHGNALLNCDKVTMAHSLEARVPFFDPALLAFAARVPPQIRMRANKVVLRESMRLHLPAFALARPKQPFGTPIRGWFESALRSRMQSILLDPAAQIRPLFQAEPLERLLRAHFDGRAKHEELVFRLLLLELWMRTFTQAQAPV